MQLLCEDVERTVESYKEELNQRELLEGADLETKVANFSLMYNLCLWFHDAVYDP